MGLAKPSERRREPRLVASLPIVFEWQTQEGELCRARGTIQNISPGGVYCHLEQPLPLRLAVQFQVAFPAGLAVGERLHFHSSGRVLRVESLGRRFGITASIETRQAIDTGPMEQNRRVHARIMPFASIPVQYPGLRLLVRDLSPTGAFIEDERPLPVGRVFEMTLGGEGPLQEVRLRAVVRRTEPYIGMAVEFVALGKEANRRLQEFLEKCVRRRVA